MNAGVGVVVSQCLQERQGEDEIADLVEVDDTDLAAAHAY